MQTFVTDVRHTFETLSIATRVVKSERAVYVTRSMYVHGARQTRVSSRRVGKSTSGIHPRIVLSPVGARPETRVQARTRATDDATSSLSRGCEPLRDRLHKRGESASRFRRNENDKGA